VDIEYEHYGTLGTYVRLLAGRINSSKDFANGAGLILYYGPWSPPLSGEWTKPLGYGAGRVYAFELVPGRLVTWARAQVVFKPAVSESLFREIMDNWDAITKDHVGPTVDWLPPVGMAMYPPMEFAHEMWDASLSASTPHP
jgi:hypothetical protein